MKLIKLLSASLLLLFLTAAGLQAQTSLTTTTLSTAMTDTSGTLVVVASATGMTAAGTGANLVYLYIDQEVMIVRAVSGTNISVSRGALGSRSMTHQVNSLIYVAPPAAITSVDLNGSCTATNQVYLPIINYRTYTLWNCAPSGAALTAAQGGTSPGTVAAVGQWQGWGSTPTSERGTRTAVATQAYTILPTDYIVALTTASQSVSMRSYTLPSHVGLAGKLLIIKDEAGVLSSTTGIVLVGTIDGTNSASGTVIQMKTAFQSVGLYAGSGGWFTLWCSGAGSGILSWGQTSSCR